MAEYMTTLPNAVIPSGFDSAAQAAMAATQSPMERANSKLAATQAQPSATPSQSHADFDSSLESARRADQGQVAPPRQPAPPPAAPAQPAAGEQPTGDKPAIEFKTKLNGRAVAAQKRNAEGWNHLTATRDEAVARAQLLEQQLTQARGGQQPGAQQNGHAPAIDYAKLPVNELLEKHPDLKKLRDEHAEFYEEIKGIRVEADPAFRAKFDSQRDAVIGVAKRAAGGAADDIGKILSNPDSEVRHTLLAERLAAGNFSDATKSRILAANAQLDVVGIAREAEVASRKATWEHTQASRDQQRQQQVSQRMAHLDDEFAQAVAKWTDPDKGMPFVMNDPSRLIANAKRIFSGETGGAQLAEAALSAAALPEVIRAAHNDAVAYGAEIQRLQEQVFRLTGAYPVDDTGTQTSETNGRVNAQIYDPVSFHQQFDSGLAAARARDARGGR